MYPRLFCEKMGSKIHCLHKRRQFSTNLYINVLFVRMPCNLFASWALYLNFSVLEPPFRFRPKIIKAVFTEQFFLLFQTNIISHSYLLRKLHVTFLKFFVFAFCRFAEKYTYAFLGYFYLPVRFCP